MVNIILRKWVPQDTIIRSTTTSLLPFGSRPIKPLGEFTADTSWGPTTVQAIWIILDNNALEGKAENILSCQTAERLGILKIHDKPPNLTYRLNTTSTESTEKLISKYEDIFEGLGKLKAQPVTLYTNPDIKPVIQPPRPIPYHLRDQFHEEIDKMEKDDLIENHTSPVTWC